MKYLLIILCTLPNTALVAQDIAGKTKRNPHQPSILLDRYFNSEKRISADGENRYWHYTWEESTYPGFSVWGDIFLSQGARLDVLDTRPTARSLKSSSVYIIVDPDHVKDNPHPNYLAPQDIKVIRDWVHAGGLLVLLGNDSANCDLSHLNLLARTFGIRFTDTSTGRVPGDDFEKGAIKTGKNEIFPERKLFLKDVSALSLQSPARAIVSQDGLPIMAMSHYGKGTVFAIGDPWLYNEYIDNRRLPSDFENFAAAEDLVKWIMKQVKK